MIVGRACQWSGAATITASMSLRSRTRRKSRVVSSALWPTGSGSRTSAWVFATWASSTSQRATHSTFFTLTKSRRSERPMPPQPMSPIRTRSLGRGSWSGEAALEDGRARAAALAAPSPIVSRRNFRRLAAFTYRTPKLSLPHCGGGTFEGNAIPVVGECTSARARREHLQDLAVLGPIDAVHPQDYLVGLGHQDQVQLQHNVATKDTLATY